MSSHQFPKNSTRRKEWLQCLNIKEQDHNKINQLRVCYKHFRDSDYSCTFCKRYLIDRAVLSIYINMPVDHTYAKPFEEQQTTIQMSQEKVIADRSRQQLLERQNCDTDTLLQTIITDHDITMAHEQSIQSLKQTVDIMNQELQAQLLTQQQTVEEIKQLKAHTRRPYLGEITRKRKLSFTARKFYDNNIKLVKQTKRLKRKISSIHKDIQSKTSILNKTDNNGRINDRAVIRQEFIDMIKRNTEVAPQVKK